MTGASLFSPVPAAWARRPSRRDGAEGESQPDVGIRRAYYSQLAEFSGPKRPGCFDFLSAPSLINGERRYRKEAQ